MINKYYMAYGSNMDTRQMLSLCPSAKIVGTGTLENFRLIFKKYATIEPIENSIVPVAIWKIDDRCECRLDHFFECPEFYHKENFEVCLSEGKYITALSYVINSDAYELPDNDYLAKILLGYVEMNIDCAFLLEAISNTEEYIRN